MREMTFIQGACHCGSWTRPLLLTHIPQCSYHMLSQSGVLLQDGTETRRMEHINKTLARFNFHGVKLGWGLLGRFFFRYFSGFSYLSKQWLPIAYHVHIWQLSPQLSCGDNCQIWMWFKESNIFSYFIISKLSITEKLTNEGLVPPTPVVC